MNKKRALNAIGLTIVSLFIIACFLSFFDVGTKYFAVPHVGCGWGHHEIYQKSKPAIAFFKTLEPYPGATYTDTNVQVGGDCVDSDPSIIINKTATLTPTNGATVFGKVNQHMLALGFRNTGTTYGFDEPYSKYANNLHVCDGANVRLTYLNIKDDYRVDISIQERLEDPGLPLLTCGSASQDPHDNKWFNSYNMTYMTLSIDDLNVQQELGPL